MSELDKLVWVERYRPRKLDDAILPEATKKMVSDFLAKDDIPHLLLTGAAGTGKTTLAKVIAEELGADLLYINASREGIDAIRTTVIQYASSVSFGGGLKIVLFDEFDGASTQSQQSMRGIIEEFPNARFFFTCNFKNKIIDAIHSRCVTIEFKSNKTEQAKLQSAFYKRVIQILTAEKIAFDKAVVADLIKLHYPDFRKTLNELQRYSSGGSIDAGILVNQTAATFDELVAALRKKNFNEMRKWVGQNTDIDPETLFREFYDRSNALFKPESIPSLVILLADYSYKASMVADPQILIAAALTELMVSAVWIG